MKNKLYCPVCSGTSLFSESQFELYDPIISALVECQDCRARWVSYFNWDKNVSVEEYTGKGYNGYEK